MYTIKLFTVQKHGYAPTKTKLYHFLIDYGDNAGPNVLKGEYPAPLLVLDNHSCSLVMERAYCPLVSFDSITRSLQYDKERLPLQIIRNYEQAG